MFSLFGKPDKRIEELEKKVEELEQGIIACVKLMKLQSEAMGSLASEVVNLSNAMKAIVENKQTRGKQKAEDYFH